MAPWHFLYFLPEPQGHSSLRPTFAPAVRGRCRWWPLAMSQRRGPGRVRAASSSGTRARGRRWWSMGRDWRRVRARAAGAPGVAAGHWCWPAGLVCRGAALSRETGGLDAGELLGGLDGSAVGADDLHAEEVARGVFLEAHHHGLEHLEGLFLVGDEGILLGVAAEADAFLEVVHGEEVILPEAVEDGEHDDALVVAHLVGRRGSSP